jgi:hypothetical protein
VQREAAAGGRALVSLGPGKVLGTGEFSKLEPDHFTEDNKGNEELEGSQQPSALRLLRSLLFKV